MKNSLLLVALMVGSVFTNCDKETEAQAACDSEIGHPINDQSGRIYEWTDSHPHFYYIGNTTQVSHGKNGGYIPCNDLPEELQVEGLTVKYSGIDKGSLPDVGDPLFAFIRVTKIEKAE
jgi:hypothetical protein